MATVYYRWHPLYGQSLRVWRRMKNRHGEHMFCELPNGTICSLPAWVFSPDCASFSVGPPLACAAALVELRDLLSAWQSSTDCGKPSMEESPREVGCDSPSEAAGLTVEPVAHRCPEDSYPGRQTAGVGSGARGTPDRGGPGKPPAGGGRRRR